MPQISIPKTMDAAHLASIAHLGNAWGVVQNADDQTFAFMAEKFTSVEAALEEYPTSYLEYQKGLKLEELADYRRTHELRGPSGLHLDDKTVARLTAAAVGLQLDETVQEVRWEISRGVFVTMPRLTVLGLAKAAFRHVQACFDNVYFKSEAINSVVLNETTDLDQALITLNDIDLTTGWPA